MKKRFPGWILGLLVIGLLILVPYVYQQQSKKQPHDAAARIPVKSVHVDHHDIVKGDFKTGQDVTRACLVCHKDAAAELMKTTHWTWESKPVAVPWRTGLITIGKINQINNFCIGSQGNENKCMSCHAGYGWEAGRTAQQANPSGHAKAIMMPRKSPKDLPIDAQQVIEIHASDPDFGLQQIALEIRSGILPDRPKLISAFVTEDAKFGGCAVPGKIFTIRTELQFHTICRDRQ